MRKIYLIYDPLETAYVKENVIPLFGYHLKEYIPYKINETPSIGNNETVAVFLDDESLKSLCPTIVKNGWKLGLLPHPGFKQARDSFGISSDLGEAVEDIIEQESPFHVDMMYCNNQLVFNSIVIGDALNLSSKNPIEQSGVFKNIGNIFSKLNTLEPKAFRIIVENKPPVDTAAVGILVANHGNSSLLSRRILDGSSINDGIIDTIIIAPRSLSGLFSFALKSFFSNNKNSLPPFAAHIQSKKISIHSRKPFDFSLDGIFLSAGELEILIEEKQLSILPGRHLSTVEPN